jgi:hypothetical protein
MFIINLCTWGEVKKVKKMAVKVLVPILALLMLLSMASSVKACVFPPPTKTPISALITGFTSLPSVTTTKYVVRDDIEYLLYLKFSGTIAIYNSASEVIATVSWVDVCWGTYNIATNKGSYTFYEVWTILSGQSAGGTFVGFDHPHSVGDFLASFGITTNPPMTALEGHIIVFGIGACAGQVIDVYCPNMYVSPYFTGYWLIR